MSVKNFFEYEDDSAFLALWLSGGEEFELTVWAECNSGATLLRMPLESARGLRDALSGVLDG